jgi:hypothetical protein
VPSKILCSRLRELSEAVTEGEKGVKREFYMSVPAQVEHDADLVLDAAAKRIECLQNIKTYKEWEKSDLDLGEYLPYPCEIDEDLHNYIAEIVPPHYCDNKLTQGGDCIEHLDAYYQSERIGIYNTVGIVGDRFFYLGQLPEFKA